MDIKVSPVLPVERIQLLDILRGFAIFGILMVNMQIFYQPATIMISGYTGSLSRPGMLSEAFIKFFFEGKFYVMFSMLFGYGFWIFINKVSGEGSDILPVFRRRLFVLLLIGILHVVLLWPGDILVWYSLFGFVLILFRKKSDSGILKWAFWLMVLPALLTALSVLGVKLGMMNPESAGLIESGMKEREAYLGRFIEHAGLVYATGTFTQIVTVRLQEYVKLLPGILFFYPAVLAMFLTGVWAARKGVIKNYPDNIQFFRRLFWSGLGFGTVFNAVYTYSYFRAGAMSVPDQWVFLSTLTHIAGGFAFCLFYVSAIVLLFAKGKCNAGVRYFAPVGRMALTNYLLHSVICTTIFLSYGFGLFGEITAFQGIMLSIMIFILQIPFSRFWLKHFNFGPFEWIWRSVTYLKWQDLRRVRKEG